MVAAAGEEWRRERALNKKMLFYDERSRNVYENKQMNDNFTEGKADIFVHMTNL